MVLAHSLPIPKRFEAPSISFQCKVTIGGGIRQQEIELVVAIVDVFVIENYLDVQSHPWSMLPRKSAADCCTWLLNSDCFTLIFEELCVQLLAIHRFCFRLLQNL